MFIVFLTICFGTSVATQKDINLVQVEDIKSCFNVAITAYLRFAFLIATKTLNIV
jgi:hypothetical protein